MDVAFYVIVETSDTRYGHLDTIRLDYDWIDMITRYKRTVNPEDFLGSVIAPLYMFDNIQTMLVSKSQTVLTTMALQ